MERLAKPLAAMLNLVRIVLRYVRFWGGQYECIICKRRVRRFFPFSTELQQAASTSGFSHAFRDMETLNLEQCNCPFCMSIDRERLYMIFLLEYFNREPKKQYKILDFAPSRMFSTRLRAISSVSYTSADIFRSDVDLQMDVCNMVNVANESFDIVICSHILEHVSNANKAILEINRIMKSDALAIIMVPLFKGVEKTIEEHTPLSEIDRYKYFGQADHVRLFAKSDFLKQLRDNGFEVNQITEDKLNRLLIRRNAIAPNSILYVCSKTN